MKTLEYQSLLKYLAQTAVLLTEMPIDELLLGIEKAEAVGPMLDPSLYREKSAAMAQDKKLLQAAKSLMVIGKELRKEKEIEKGEDT